MVNDQSHPVTGEEIVKKIDQRLDRNGLFTIVIVISLLLLAAALFTVVWQRPTRNIRNLESRINQLESRIDDLEATLAEGAQ